MGSGRKADIQIDHKADLFLGDYKAMKMEHGIKAPADRIISDGFYNEGDKAD